ncbi:beta-ketoacyl synthase N-terminal-like domain-containing protein [Streptomyces sp. NPDC048211]|uniref:beta-ketoacyl synthase N-terminal-like domain-containing protein n=1 Tax=Streptomyces sp. NPDC048211 TaxID=3365516 RepID=UPI00371FE2C4
MSRSVTITGVGLATALGAGLDATWEGLRTGRSAVTAVAAPEGLYPGQGPVPAAALSDDLADVSAFGRRRLRALSRESLLVSRAGLLAWQDAGLDAGGAPAPEDLGVVLGTAGAGLTGYLQVLHDGLTLGVDLVSPYAGPQGSLNAAVSDLAIAADAEGPVVTVTAGRCSGAEALMVAADLVRTDQAEVVLVAAVDVLDPLRLAGADTGAGTGTDTDAGTDTGASAGKGAVDRGADGRSARLPRPFAPDRTGPLPGEAVVVLVVEDAGRARGRGARIHAEVAAVSTALGVPGDTDGEAAARAVDTALAAAGLTPGTVGLVCSSADGSGPVDRAEAHALSKTFGADTPVFTACAAVGDCAGATPLLQVALAVRALQDGVTPATAGLADWDPALPRLAVSDAPQRLPAATAALVLTTDERPGASAVVLRIPRRDPCPQRTHERPGPATATGLGGRK